MQFSAASVKKCRLSCTNRTCSATGTRDPRFHSRAHRGGGSPESVSKEHARTRMCRKSTHSGLRRAPTSRCAAGNDAHSAELEVTEKHEKHKFAPGAKECAEVNTDRFDDEEMVKTDNWPGGFYMEVPRPRSRARRARPPALHGPWCETSRARARVNGASPRRSGWTGGTSTRR